MSGLFDDPPPIPPPSKPPPMPDSESPLVQEAERRRTASILSRGGRASTILSQDEGSNMPYAKTKMG